ncbi:MAG: hypothetical protein VB877_05865 [Pirellulaceae bacterium]
MTRKMLLVLLVGSSLLAMGWLQEVSAAEGSFPTTDSGKEVTGNLADLADQLAARGAWRRRRESREEEREYRSAISVPGLPRVPAAAAVTETPSADSSTAGQDRPGPGDNSDFPAVTPEAFRQLQASVRRTLDTYYPKTINVADRSPWSVMHTLIAYGVDTQVYADSKKVNAIGWLCWNQPCYGQRIFYTRNDKIRTRQGVGVEGHEGQFLSMLAQSRVKADYPMKVDGGDFTVMDLVRHEQASCRAGTELTFKLIGLTHYLPSDAKWENDLGEEWDMERLIAEELKQSVIGSACGGTHRLLGYSYAVRKREQRGEPMTGQWARANQYVKDFHDYTFRLQNENGSFSANWSEGRGDWGNIDRRMDTTGHTLEWMAFSLQPEQLKDPRVVKAVAYLSQLMYEHRSHEWEIGPRGHALHALAIYNQRMFGAGPGYQPAAVVGKISSASQD